MVSERFFDPRAYRSPLLTTTQVAFSLNCTTQTVVNMCKRGELPYVRHGKWRYISKQVLIDYMAGKPVTEKGI